MASTQLQTVTAAVPFAHGRALARAGSRLWAAFRDGSNYVYQYSDDSGANWSAETTVRTGAEIVGSLFYDSGNGRMNFATAGANSLSIGLQFHSITTGVASGTPGSVNTTTIDAGGSNAGVQWPYALHSSTGSNPRYWIIAKKTTAASTYETRAWNVNVTTPANADTGGNWVVTNFTNLGGNSDANSSKMGIGTYWTVGGAGRVTFVFQEGSMGSTGYEAVTFDPAAATPTPGTVTSSLFPHSTDVVAIDPNPNGVLICMAAKADYAVFGRYDDTGTNFELWKSTNGTSWSQPSGWDNLTGIGRAQLTSDGTDFYLLYAPYGAAATTAGTLSYRKITASSDALGGATTFSDTNGNPVALPLDVSTTLPGLYRGSTASPYTLRSDSLSLSSDTTPPGQATVVVTAVAATTVDIEATMPADSDVSQWEVRYFAGSSFPATNRSDGTVSLSPTATTPSAVATHQITGLATGTLISGRVFVKDTTGNWNTGATFTATPGAFPAFLQRYREGGLITVASGTAVGGPRMVIEYQLASADMLNGGANVHLRWRDGTDNATPPTADTLDLFSKDQPESFQYQDSSGAWQQYPPDGLESTDWSRKVRALTSRNVGAFYGSIRVEQLN